MNMKKIIQVYLIKISFVTNNTLSIKIKLKVGNIFYTIQ